MNNTQIDYKKDKKKKKNPVIQSHARIRDELKNFLEKCTLSICMAGSNYVQWTKMSGEIARDARFMFASILQNLILYNG